MLEEKRSAKEEELTDMFIWRPEEERDRDTTFKLNIKNK